MRDQAVTRTEHRKLLIETYVAPQIVLAAGFTQ
jgi:hypothetical protein